MRALTRPQAERGFTLIEVMVTMLLLVVGIAGALALIDGANARTVATKQREAGNALSREVIEAVRSVPYRQLNPGSAITTVQGIPGLEDTTPLTGAWSVERRKTVYTITMSVCTVDDDQDQLGDHTGGGYCGTATGTADRNPDDYKRVTVNVEWTTRGVTKSIQQAGIVSNEASTAGPALEILSQDPDTSTTGELNSNSSPIKFEVQADSDAVAIRFAVDGVIHGSTTSTHHTFDWNIDGSTHVPDGTYVVSFTAFDAEDTPGPTRSRTIRLNRDIPSAPQDVFGGFNPRIGYPTNQDIVEIQWSRNNEPDVKGYRIYRKSSSTAAEIVPGCDYAGVPTQTECIDTNPPSDASIEYWVVAVDENPFTGGARDGEESASIIAVRGTTHPNQPLTLTATQDGADVVLTWPDALPALPPYSGSDVIFYRVYRDGKKLADRIARTGQESLTTYRDLDAAAGNHQYFVSSVDENFAESLPLGPVQIP
jgi:prepilin-type N-terminal cleavage/methylation domain-containing protein